MEVPHGLPWKFVIQETFGIVSLRYPLCIQELLQFFLFSGNNKKKSFKSLNNKTKEMRW